DGSEHYSTTTLCVASTAYRICQGFREPTGCIPSPSPCITPMRVSSLETCTTTNGNIPCTYPILCPELMCTIKNSYFFIEKTQSVSNTLSCDPVTKMWKYRNGNLEQESDPMVVIACA
ncbi:hypothetical protein PMAYCL1PPCAC_28130, partial [Pristionchus mayeri]